MKLVYKALLLFQVYSKVIKYIFMYVHIYIYIYMYILFQILFYYMLLQNIEYSPLGSTVGFCLSVLYIVVCMC